MLDRAGEGTALVDDGVPPVDRLLPSTCSQAYDVMALEPYLNVVATR
jgi:hypothetical protein